MLIHFVVFHEKSKKNGYVTDAAELFSMHHHHAVLPLDGCQKNWPEFIR